MNHTGTNEIIKSGILREPVKLGHIDILRGVAIILVVICHVAVNDNHIGEAVRDKLLFGQVGVQLFFVLSAYTLCLSMSERKESDHVKKFYLRRFFRIAPLYYVGMIIYYIVFKVDVLNQLGRLKNYPGYGVSTTIYNIFFVHGFFTRAYNNTVPGGWSISTEMMFYAIFPFIFYLFTKVKKRFYYLLLPIVALVIANIYMGLLYLKVGNKVLTEHFFYAFIINQLPVFIIGMSYFFAERAGLIKVSKLVSIVCFLLLFFLSYKLMALNFSINLPIFVVAISYCFLFKFFKDANFHLPLLRRVGQLSYSIYITHVLFAFPLSTKISALIGSQINGYLVFMLNLFVTLSMSFLVAIITEKYIEKPGINLGKLFIKRIENQKTIAINN